MAAIAGGHYRRDGASAMARVYRLTDCGRGEN